MRIVPTNKRKAISPVLATVILIAITLIAAIAIAGFVFGLFGTFTSTARVSASVTSCAAIAGPYEQCSLVLTNTGNANLASPTVCSLTFNGGTHTGAYAVVSGTLNSGSAQTGTCTNNDAKVSAITGSQVTGSVILANGGNALFSGVAS